MNVRIDGKGLRFKITEEELKHLLSGTTLEEVLPLGRRALSVVIDPVGVSDELMAIYDEDTIRLVISPAKVQELADMGRSREGLAQSRDDLSVSLQVDFRTQKRKAA